MANKSLNERFTDFADLVSEVMGTPTNIGFWFFLVFAWFAIFAINPGLQNSNFLPSWFTSNAFNFPLNSITTLCELFIGFLCAAATNRAQRILMQVLGQLQIALGHLEEIEEQMQSQTQEILDLQKDTHSLTQEIHTFVKK